jgi:hypothetical protein
MTVSGKNEGVTSSAHGASTAAAGRSREVLDSLRWAIAEIEGRTRYSNEGQRSICLARAHNALSAAEVDRVLSMSDEDVIASVGGPVAAEAIATEMREMVSRILPAAASEQSSNCEAVTNNSEPSP